MTSKPKKQKIKLVCFDFDGTLVDFSPQISSWQRISNDLGFLKEVEQLRKDHHAGKITYYDWPQKEAGLWMSKGASKKQMQAFLKKAKPMKNSLKVLKTLKARGIKLALISGALDFAFEVFFPRSLFNHIITEKAFFNENDKLERVEVFCASEKLAHVKNLARLEGLKLSEVAFVGDGFIDIEALKGVGLGIAFNPQAPEIEKAAKVVIKEKDYNKLLEVIV